MPEVVGPMFPVNHDLEQCHSKVTYAITLQEFLKHLTTIRFSVISPTALHKQFSHTLMDLVITQLQMISLKLHVSKNYFANLQDVKFMCASEAQQLEISPTKTHPKKY